MRRPVDIGVARALAVGAILAFAVVGAWTQWQPQRSVDAGNAALVALDARDPALALADARLAVSRDPLSLDALTVLSEVQLSAGDVAGAQATLNQAVTLQPANPQAWLELAALDEAPAVHDPRAALAALRPAIFLDPSSATADGEFVAALRLAQPSTPIIGVQPAVPLQPTRAPGAGGGR